MGAAVDDARPSLEHAVAMDAGVAATKDPCSQTDAKTFQTGWGMDAPRRLLAPTCGPCPYFSTRASRRFATT